MIEVKKHNIANIQAIKLAISKKTNININKTIVSVPSIRPSL